MLRLSRIVCAALLIFFVFYATASARMAVEDCKPRIIQQQGVEGTHSELSMTICPLSVGDVLLALGGVDRALILMVDCGQTRCALEAALRVSGSVADTANTPEALMHACVPVLAAGMLAAGGTASREAVARCNMAAGPAGVSTNITACAWAQPPAPSPNRTPPAMAQSVKSEARSAVQPASPTPFAQLLQHLRVLAPGVAATQASVPTGATLIMDQATAVTADESTSVPVVATGLSTDMAVSPVVQLPKVLAGTDAKQPAAGILGGQGETGARLQSSADLPSLGRGSGRGSTETNSAQWQSASWSAQEVGDGVVTWLPWCACGQEWAPVCSLQGMQFFPSLCWAECQGVPNESVGSCLVTAEAVPSANAAMDAAKEESIDDDLLFYYYDS